MSSPKEPARLSGRTRIITAASIGAVGLASVFAIGANLGILSSANDTKVGTLAASGDLLPATTSTVDVSLDEQGNPLATDPSASAASRHFIVDAAGSIDVSAVGGIARIDRITTTDGWTATAPTTTTTGVAVTLTDGTRTLDFTATVADDGIVIGDVTEATTAAPTKGHGDDHEPDEHEADEHDYEGGDSDD
jgi:hypothetical protein